MSTVQEYSSVMEKKCLYVEWARLEESYDRIVVIDPRAGGEDEGIKTVYPRKAHKSIWGCQGGHILITGICG